MNIGFYLFIATIVLFLAYRFLYRRYIEFLNSRLVNMFASLPTVSSRGTWMPVLVSFAVLGSALYVILSKKYDEASAKWAFGTVGLIVGYWLKQ